MPIDRSGNGGRPRARCRGQRVLGEGELFGIYPEGTRSHDGRLYRGKVGVAAAARCETRSRSSRCAVVGTDVVARRPARNPGSFTRPMVRFGKPLDFSRYEGMENDRYILRSITDEIMYEIMRLSGQEYVDQYAARAKEESKRRLDKEQRRRRHRAGDGRAEEGVLSPRPPGSGPAARAVEDRMFAALAVLRVLVLLNAVALDLYRVHDFAHPRAADRQRAGDGRWTAVAIAAYGRAARRNRGAWLLLDEDAIRVVAGNPNGTRDLGLPSAAGSRAIADPKRRLRDALVVAADCTGRRLDIFKRRFNEHRRLLLERLDLCGPVTGLEAMQALQVCEVDRAARLLRS